MQVLINGRPWDVPIGLLDVRNSFGENAVIFDSNGCPIPTNSLGITLAPLQAGASYAVEGYAADMKNCFSVFIVLLPLFGPLLVFL